MSNELVTLERRDDKVAVLTLNNPKVNALSTALLGRLHELALELTSDPAGAVVITGGDRLFAAGADISEFAGPEQAQIIADGFHRALDAVAAIPSFVIAAVSGFALGGGCELALACDYRIASSRAVFGQPEVLLGILPGGGGTQRLPRLVGVSRAKEMMFTGRQVKAEEALRIGLADEIVESDMLMTRALALATEVANSATVAVRLMKKVVDEGVDMSLADALTSEKKAFVEVFGTEDAAVGVKSFRDNGPGHARFTGR